MSVIGDLRKADRDHYDLVLAVTDGGVPAQSAVVTLSINMVSTMWSEPHAGQVLEGEREGRAASVVDVFFRHRLILIVLSFVTVMLTVLLVLAIVCVKCRQVKPMLHLARHVSTRHTFDVSSPCILAVSSLSNSTARRARHD